MNASFTRIDPLKAGPEAADLQRCHALLLYAANLAEGGPEHDWWRPEILRRNTQPLLVAGERGALWRRGPYNAMPMT
jgi:hypothetical protein